MNVPLIHPPVGSGGGPTEPYEAWLLTGSQHLYGAEVLAEVEAHAERIGAALGMADAIPVRVVCKPVLTTAAAIREVCLAANAAPGCVGVITWMHTFSPAKMWIAGLDALRKPLVHLHTQFNRDLPWSSIDMDFMNRNQSAHGDREFGYIATRMRLRRTVVVGHWQDPAVTDRLGIWARAACGLQEARGLRVARFGDNMRDVAVTEGDKVEAELRLGVSVNAYGVADLAAAVDAVPADAVDELVTAYTADYSLPPELGPEGNRHEALRSAARIEAGLRSLLDAGGFRAFTDTFEDLGGLVQLPGIGVQRLMADGYGFGAEGDWKTATLVRLMKVMADGLPGGTSFMEDYTYHLAPPDERVLGAHMLEVCPSIAGETPSVEIHPLAIGGRGDPVRLVFTAAPGPAIVAGLIDLGDRFRLVANEIELVEPPEAMPKLPVARAVWRPKPDLRTSAEAWILAGGPHHTAMSQALTLEHLADLADMAGIEFVRIDDRTDARDLKRELEWNEAYHRVAAPR
jgi:L-arabinose isomerase